MIWIIKNTKENFFRGLQRYSTSSTVSFTSKEKVNDIFALLVKQDLMGPHNSGPRCYDIRELFQITCVGSNIKYDSFQSTREALTQTRQCKTEKITGLKSQSEIVTSVWQGALVSTRNKWFSVRKVLPKNIFNFTIRYFNNTLATKSNMQKWGKALTKVCDYCPEVQTLNHVVAACKSALREGRYTWRHNSILLNLSLIINPIRPGGAPQLPIRNLLSYDAQTW